MERILEEIKIGDTMSVGAHREEDIVGLYIASPEVSASLSFEISKDEWKKFVDAVKEIDKKIS